MNIKVKRTPFICTIINAFVTFDTFDGSLLNKSINSLKQHKTFE